MMRLTAIFILLPSLFGVCLAEKIFTQQLNPVITNINPWYSGIDGGTQITISGANLGSSVLFTETVVFIGNEKCDVISHFSGMEKIVCITPKCYTETCRNGNIWSGASTVELSVYVSSVEGILTTSSVFYYYNYYTPYVYMMHSSTWGSATSVVHARARVFELSDVDIVIGDGYHGYLGTAGELNYDELPYSSNDHYLYYRPPSDISGGFHNLSLYFQDDLKDGNPSLGVANMFENDRYDTSKYGNFYLFQSTPQGTSYSLCVFPSIASVSPHFGSIGGGTIVTIEGTGFSKDSSELEVFVSGQPCHVVASDVHTIQCMTSPRFNQTFLYSLTGGDTFTLPEYLEQNEIFPSSRKYGSPGWWVKTWNYDSYYAGYSGLDAHIELAFGWRQGAYMSFYDHVFEGYSWPDTIGFSTSYEVYAKDAGAVFIAPYAGHYTFFVASDDQGYLYASSSGMEIDEILIAYNSRHSSSYKFHRDPSKQISEPIPLGKGERLYLRFRHVNTYGYDFSLLAVKISPAYDCDGALMSHWEPGSNITVSCEGNAVAPHVLEANFPDRLIQLHSTPEVQEIHLDFEFHRERQLINITGASSGDFLLVVQGRQLTEYLSMDSSASTIRNALNAATQSISSSIRETYSFLVWTERRDTSLEIYVEFSVDNTSPLTLLQIYPVSLVGSNPHTSVTRIQEHTPFPSDSFEILFGDGSDSSGPIIPWDSWISTVESNIEGYFDDNRYNVEVTRSGWSLTGYVWTVSFITPRGDVPQMRVDVSGISGPNVTGYVTTQSNGSTSELWFEPIPSWMTEVPVEWATAGKVQSNVEVYRRSAGGDIVKAVCDGSGYRGSGFEGMIKGGEADCAFSYNSNATAVVSNYSILSYVDAQTVEVGIFGHGFLKQEPNSTITVAIAGKVCNITLASDEKIICRIKNVPWGSHVVAVTLSGLGSALRTTDTMLNFSLDIYSVDPPSGSLSGGQWITITGKGFRNDSTVSMGSGLCDIQYLSPSQIICITPPVKSFLGRDNSTNCTQTSESCLPSYANVTAWEENTTIAIDGYEFPGMYVHDILSTPTIDVVSPRDISSALTTLVEIIGLGFVSNSSVSIDGNECIVQVLYPDMIECLLVRSLPTQQKHGNVKVYVPNVGYASEAGDVTELPVVNFGYEVHNVYPWKGSLKGGTRLYIDGFGFMENGIDRHTVSLKDRNYISSEYEELLFGLGLSDRPGGIVYCEVIEVSFNQIVCELEETISVVNDTSYIVSVAVNGMTAICDDTQACSYQQAASHTPVVYSTHVVSRDNNTGHIDVHVYGNENLVNATNPAYSLNRQSCVVIDHVTDYVTVRCPSSPAGSYVLSVFVEGLGKAHVEENATVLVTMWVSEVSAMGYKGSLGGGTPFVLTGYGFGKSCSENTVSMRFSNNEIMYLPNTSFVNCAVNTLFLRTPSVITLYGGIPFDLNSAENFSVVEIAVYYNGMSASTGLSFTFSPLYTPVVAVQGTSGFAESNISLNISIPEVAANSRDFSVTVGGETCTSLSSKPNRNTSIELICDAPALPGDLSYGIEALILPFGVALTSLASVPTFYSEFAVNPLDTIDITSSVAGGSVIDVIGKGLSAGTQVHICGQPCMTQVSSYNHISCTTPPRMTVSAVEHFESIGASIDTIEDIVGGIVGSNGNYLRNLEDGDYTTYFFHDSIHCYIGIDLPVGFVARPYRLRFYPRLQYANDVGGSVFEGSVDGGKSYIVIDRILSAHEGWNYMEANETLSRQWFTSFRFRSTASVSSKCMISEIRFLGTVAARDETCEVSVTSSEFSSSVLVGNITYDAVVGTPFVKSISPNNGTALGGTAVSIRGYNFASIQNMSSLGRRVTMDGMNHSSEKGAMVHLNGMMCHVTSITDYEINCTTVARDLDHLHHSETSVRINSLGIAVTDLAAKYLYIDRWSDLTTWRNKEPPVDGDLVWIPEGQVVLLDIESPVLSLLLIEGELYFDPTRDVRLDAHYIYVNGGRLQVGTAEEPYERNAVITLHGDRYTSIEIPHIGSKCLAVAAKGMVHSHGSTGAHVTDHDMGFIEIHGSKRLRTWTKLNETASAGLDHIVTSEAVDFKEGERIVITGSEIPVGDNFQEEVVTVISTYNYHTVKFYPPLQFTHRSEIVVVEGRELDLRCEVGLLTRNVVIQGDDSSDEQLFGVHTIGMSGTYRIENAEITKCGQAFNLGRYCTHAHHAGNFEGNYIKANSIHRSYQRAVTTHDTSYWEVRDNVAYDVMGHAYFVEDGNEFYNSISGNLGIRIKTSSALLKSDTKPAVFWTTNPNNFWYDNVGVHSHSFGFWFELPSSPPVGVVNNICSHNEHLGEFSNNTFRANGQLGLRIYPRWTPHVDPCDENSPPAPQYLRTMLSYRNAGNGMFSKNHGDLHHLGHTFLENGGTDISIAHYVHVEYNSNPAFLDTYIIGSLSDIAQNASLGAKFAVWAPQDEFFYMKNTTIINFGVTGALSGCNDCASGEEMNQGAFTYRFEGMNFINSDRRTRWSPHYKQIFWDLDGSIAGHANSYVLQWYDFNAWSPHCTPLSKRNYGDSMLCVNTTVRRVEIDYVEPNQVDFTDIKVYGSDRSAEVYFLPFDSYGWVVPLVMNQSYGLEWHDAGVSPTEFEFNLGATEYIKEMYDRGVNETVRLSFMPNRHDYIPYSYSVHYGAEHEYSSRNFSASLTDRMGTSSFVNNTLNVILSSNGADWNLDEPFAVAVEAELCPPSGCPIPPLPSLPSNYSLWSDPSSWPDGILPVAGSDVVIEADMWIHMDISPPPFRSVTIYGALTFKSGMSSTLTLEANNIIVYGSFEVSGVDKKPFNGNAEIILSGDKSSSIPIVVGEDRFIGSKVMAVMGNLVLVGKQIADTWARLAATANRGDNIAVINSTQISWEVGDEVVFSPTGYFGVDGELWSNEDGAVEYRTITGISKSGELTDITLDKPLSQPHLCTVVENHSFCGAVGLVTRNIKVFSRDSEDDSTSSDFGFGGHIVAVDLVEELYEAERYFTGSLYLVSVEMKNLGKANSDHYAIGFEYSGSHGSSVVTNCSLNRNYNFALGAFGTRGLVFDNNIAVDNWGGGVYIDMSCSNFSLVHNLVVGVHQLPSVLKSSFPWTRPVAAFTIASTDGIIQHNLAAGSVDQGFAIATKLFIHSDESLCQVTRGLPYTHSAAISPQQQFLVNEAVACRGGLSVMNMGSAESSPSDCAVVNGIKAWRNAHTGIMAIAAEANVIVANVILAENHIGVVADYFKVSSNAFSGVISSTIIGSMHSNGYSDLPDSAWDRKCQVFSEADPHGLTSVCRSTISSFYQRVGILLPQFTNRGKTCAVEGRWDQCQPATTPDRLCALPYEKRYGLPMDMQYSEMHVHDTVFTGFRSADTIPDTTRSSAAIAINPSQLDQQPSVVVSGLVWSGVDDGRMDREARFGFKSTGAGCNSRTCMGLDMGLIYDIDGSGAGYEHSGQIVFGNPGYTAPHPLCSTASELGVGVAFCWGNGNESSTTSFRQYSAVWRDYQTFLIGPIQVTRRFESLQENRTYASYGPTDDSCPKRFYFSRFPLYISPGMKHDIVTTGTVPTTWFFRWDSPFDSDSAVLEFFIHGSNSVRVFIASTERGPYIEVPRFTDRYPTLDDPAGSSARNPQKRTLTVTIRGGSKRFYKFVVVPVVAINMKIETDFDSFNSNNFIANVAFLLNIPLDRIKIAEVRRGSVIVDFYIEASPESNSNITSTDNSTDAETVIANQVTELQAVASNFSKAVFSGALETTLGASIDTLTVVEPVIPEVIPDISNANNDNDDDLSSNTTNTDGGSSTSNGNVLYLVSKPPTNFPTSSPTVSHHPTHSPTPIPTGTPTAPTSFPTTQAQTQLTLPGSCSLSGVTVSNFSKNYSDSFTESIASSMSSSSNREFDSSHVIIRSVEDVLRRVLFNSNPSTISKRELSGSGVVVVFDIVFIVEQFGFEVDNVVTSIRNQLALSMSTDVLQDALNSALQSRVGDSFSPISVVGLNVNEDAAEFSQVRTAAPTPRPTSEKKSSGATGDAKGLDDWVVWTIIAVSTIFLVAVGIAGKSYFDNAGQNVGVTQLKSRKIEVEPLPSSVVVRNETHSVDELRGTTHVAPQPSVQTDASGNPVSLGIFLNRVSPHLAIDSNECSDSSELSISKSNSPAAPRNPNIASFDAAHIGQPTRPDVYIRSTSVDLERGKQSPLARRG